MKCKNILNKNRFITNYTDWEEQLPVHVRDAAVSTFDV
jgi:hypothetical protein